MIIITALWKAVPGKENELKKHLESMVQSVREEEPECLEYILQQNASDPSEFLFYEQYTNTRAIEQHKETAHFKKMLLATKDLITEPVTIKLYNLII